MSPSVDAIAAVMDQPVSSTNSTGIQHLPRLVSLTQARVIRDRAVESLLQSIEEGFRPELEQCLEGISRAEPGWHEKLKGLHHEFVRLWDGCGMPYWMEFELLERSIRYIWVKEREGVRGYALEVVR